MERNGHHPALLSLSNIKDLIPLVLDFENVPYNCWSTLFCVIARAYNVLHHIDATIPTPTVERDDPLLWAQLDAVVLSWIYATISSDLLVAILGENLTAIQTWTCLYNIFQHNNLSMTPKKRKLNINLNEEANESESEIEGESVIMDSISCLPDDVLVYLLSFVGMKTAGKTSLLSKRWRYVWTHSMDLDFDDYETTAIAKALKIKCTNSPILELDNYVKWVNQVVSANRAPYLNSFRIHYPLTLFYAPDVENWIKFAFSKNVRNLELYFWSTFQRIQFYNIFPSNPTFLVNTTLESLHLKSVLMDGHLLQWVFSNCHNLRRLSINLCKSSSKVSSEHGMENLVVSCSKLKHLDFFHSLKQLGFKTLQISAPNLTSFTYNESLIDVKYLSVPSFVAASFGHEYALHIFYNLDILSCFSSQLKKLSFTYSQRHYASRGFPNFVRVEQLEIISAPFNVNLLSLIPLIEACPLLHTFKLKFQSMEQVQWSSNEPTTAHINAIRSHQHLKTVEYVGYGGCGSSAKLALCLTNYAPMLDKFIFNPHPFKYVEYRYDVYSREYMDKMAAARCYAQGLAYKMRKSLDVVIL